MISFRSSISSCSGLILEVTKFIGLLISCAMPAVNCPNAAIFSASTSCDWASFKLVSATFKLELVFCKAMVRSLTFFSNSMFCSLISLSFSFDTNNACFWASSFWFLKKLILSANANESNRTSSTDANCTEYVEKIE
ncbi:hypothetical protein D3C86_1415590 [compost metagenome]